MKEAVKGFRGNLEVEYTNVSSNSPENGNTGVFVVDHDSASSQQPPPTTGRGKNSH
ncbi:MAG: hypothetical protein F6K41_41520, partial [Symploca sp. SIO3E6]|nr:hypothetical protein [Caldora sp. SIO3E6]